MAFDALAIIAAILIGCSEAIAISNLRLARILMGVALFLLPFASRLAYWIAFVSLVAVITCGVFLDRMILLQAKQRKNSSETSLLETIFYTSAPRWVAGLIHFWGMWFLPVCILWGVLDVYDKNLFFSEEMGHQLASVSYMLSLIITPLLLVPTGYEKGGVKHQLYESGVLMLMASIYFTSFRIAHFVKGRNPPHLTVPGYDHELIGLFWFFSGLVGLVSALQGSKTSVHIVFPAGYVYYSFIHHTDVYPDDFSKSERWLLTWVAPHQVHAVCFGVGAACRLLERIPESIYFFFLGIVTWCFATKDVALVMYNIFNWDHDPESGWSKECDPDCDVHYHTDAVVRQIVLLLGAVLFPIHFVLLGRLRTFVDHWSGVVQFSALAPKEQNGDDANLKAETVPLIPE